MFTFAAQVNNVLQSIYDVCEQEKYNSRLKSLVLKFKGGARRPWSSSPSPVPVTSGVRWVGGAPLRGRRGARPLSMLRCWKQD